jgi:hypothetical protein
MFRQRKKRPLGPKAKATRSNRVGCAIILQWLSRRASADKLAAGKQKSHIHPHGLLNARLYLTQHTIPENWDRRM